MNWRRPTVSLLAVTLLLASCSSVYRVRVADLKHAEGRWMKVPQPIAIPAWKGERKTYIEMSHVRYVTKEIEGTDQVDVATYDSRLGLKVAGFAVMAIGAALVAVTIDGADRECESRQRDNAFECVFATPFLQGMFFGLSALGGGATMAVMGFVKTRPEMKGPSPGFRRHQPTNAEPPVFGVRAVGRF